MKEWFRMWFPLLVAAVLTVGFVAVATGKEAKPPPPKPVETVLSLVIIHLCEEPYGYVFTTTAGRVIGINSENVDTLPKDVAKQMIEEAKAIYKVNIADPKFCGTDV